MPSLPPAVCLLVLTGLGLPARAQEPADRWVDIELPSGFHLDLLTGEVSGRATGDEGELSFVDGRLVATPRLFGWLRPGSERVSARVIRRGGVPANDPSVDPGTELIFDLGADCWGYLRVLEIDEGGVKLEYARGAADAESLEREPTALSVSAQVRAFHLSWLADPEAEYEIRRRVLDGGELEVVARVEGGEWVDSDSPAGRLVEYRVARVDRSAVFGTRARGAIVEQPGEWPLSVTQGTTVDLISGATDGDRAHLEIAYVNPSSVTLRPTGGARLAPIVQSPSPSWELPDVRTGRYEDKMRSILYGDTVAVYLPEGIYARVRIVREDSRITLVRQVDLDGYRVLPLPPSAPDAVVEAGEHVFRFAPLGAVGPGTDTVSLVAERELGHERDDWEEVAMGAPGVRELRRPVADTTASVEAVTRYRFRHRYPWGADSSPSPPVRVLEGDLEDEAFVAATLDRAFVDLLHSDFERRLAARVVLELLGEAAWPRLRSALESDEPELASAAREVLLAASIEDGAHIEFVLRARAAALGIEGDPPPGWFERESSRRAWALLSAHGRDEAERERAEQWTHVLVLADPDATVSRLARSLQRSPVSGPWGPRAGVPYAVVPPAGRRAAGIAGEDLDGTHVRADELLRAIRRSLDMSNVYAAALSLHAFHMVEPELYERRGGTRVDLSAVELALRLIERYRGEGDPVFLDAASALLEDRRAELFGLRDLTERRLSHERDDDVERERVVLSEPSLDLLEAHLSSFVSERKSYVDLVLPPGEYALSANPEDNWIDLQVPGLRLIGSKGTRISAGLRILDTHDIVLDGLEVVNQHGSAVIVIGGSLVAVDCRLAGAQSTLLVQNSEVELSDVECASLDGGRGSQWSVRTVGRCSILARRSFFDAGTLLLGDVGFLYLDRCVVDSDERAAIQCQRNGEVTLRDTLLRSGVGGLFNVSNGLLEGVVFDVAREPIGRAPGELRLCPQHNDVDDPAIDPVHFLDRCPLEDDR